ncbi:MAG: peptidylprolyl isomerase [Planctomycetota bacterium]|nr:peptidylprolyl isomerase [Planctomycetota bacterium]
MIGTRLLLTLPLVLALGATTVAAAPGDAVTPPEAKGIALDGRPDEAAWKQAVRLPLPPVTVPTPQGPQQLKPDVRLLSADGRLVVGVTCAEDPGTALGVHLMIAATDAKSAADAVSIEYRPVELRTPRYRALGPKGAGRAHYRVEGAADWRREGVWTLELSVPWVDLTKTPSDALRMALVVHTRTPNVNTAWPAGAMWRGPAAWSELTPPDSGWPMKVTVDAERIAAQDKADKAQMGAWLAFQKGSALPIPPTLPRAEVIERFERNVVAPLELVLQHRPDLEVPVSCLLGDAWHRLGVWRRARDLFQSAVRAAPGWREARYGLHLKVLAQRAAAGKPGGASTYAAAFARLKEAEAVLNPSFWTQEGARLGRALLQYKQGAFDDAAPVLQELAARYPFDPFLEAHARFAVAGKRAALEKAARAKREAKVTRPKADVKTTKGTFTVELLPGTGDAPNTVKNFVYLVRKKFYDGLTFHRTVPFFLVQSGDPNSRADAAKPGETGTGTPGYAIRSERNQRRMLRGAVVMASAGPDTEGSQFYVLTGTAMHLQGEQTIFGQVIAGMDVVDRLEQGDRIETITCRDLDPQARYVPITVAGREP